MKRTLIITILLAATSSVFSQAFKATYSYDAAGNRTTATIIWLTSSLKNDEVIDSAIAVETQGRASLPTTDATIPKQGYTQPNLDSLAGTKITIYPNPNTGSFTIKSSSKIKELKVYSALGVLQKKYDNIDSDYVSMQLPAGMYSVVVICDQQTLTQKIMVLQ